MIWSGFALEIGFKIIMKSPTARNLSNLIQNQNSKYNFIINFKRSDQKNKVKLFRNKGGIRKNPNKFGFFTHL